MAESTAYGNACATHQDSTAYTDLYTTCAYDCASNPHIGVTYVAVCASNQ